VGYRDVLAAPQASGIWRPATPEVYIEAGV
jgi:hypothetical protein